MGSIINDKKRITTTGLRIKAFLINQYLLTSDPLMPGAPDLPEGPCENQVNVITIVQLKHLGF